MAFDVNLYYFGKKVNSTARPTAAPITHKCIIKEPCGILNPVIGLNLGIANAPESNYVYIPAFKRYYYVKEWSYQNALWYATLECDVLASWKQEIGWGNCYIIRSSSISDGAILDITYPGTGNTTILVTTAETPWSTAFAMGHFVVGVAGITTRYYLFTELPLIQFLSYLFSDEFANELTANFASAFPALKAQCNPLQYITSIMWVPFGPEGEEVTTIRVGWVDVPVTGAEKISESVLNRFLHSGESVFAISRHPQSDRGSYLNNAPYSSYSLFFPPWGKIQLDADVVANSTEIHAEWNTDLRTCEGTLSIKNENGYLLSRLHSQIGVSHQVTQIINRGYGIGNLLQPALGAVAGVAVGGGVGAAAGAITTGFSQIGNVASSKIPTATTIGSNGGIDTLIGTPALQHEFKEIVDEDNIHRGRPLCDMRQISTLSGYIKVANAYINIPATQVEKNAIISYMEGGFFYE